MAADAKTITSKSSLSELLRALQQPLPAPPDLQRFLEALRQPRPPLPEPWTRVVQALQLQPLPEPWARLSRSLAEANQAFARNIGRRLQPRPATVAPRRVQPRPSDLVVRGAVTRLGDMPELKLWSAVKQLPGLAGARRSQVTQARWAIFGHPSKGRRGKTPKKPKLVVVGAF